MMTKVNWLVSLLLICAMVFSMPISVQAVTENDVDTYHDIVSTYSIDDSIPGYQSYLTEVDNARPGKEYRIGADQQVRYEEDGKQATPQVLTDYQGKAGAALLTSEDSLIEYEITIEEAGLYDLSLVYYPIEGKNSEIQRAFFIDGKLPYNELSLVEFKRIWVNGAEDAVVDENGISTLLWAQDNQGNDLKPSAKEQPEWVESLLYDNKGYIPQALSIYLSQGTHTITILALREPVVIGELVIKNYDDHKTYAEVKQLQDDAGAAYTSGQSIRIEAENASKTSSQMLYPQMDQSSPAVYPSSSKALLNNSIGGNSWRLAGQWLEWEFFVPEDGYYNISMYDKQSFVRGIDVARKIYIDGKVPFEEFSYYNFAYEQSWRYETLTDDAGAPYDIYLTKGKHTIRMEVVLGDMASIISQMQENVKMLNAIYRQVIYITGVAPDKFRDYQIEASLPGLKEDLIEAKNGFDLAREALRITAGSNSDKLTALNSMADQLDEFIADQERFTEVMGSFKSNVRACGNWITQVMGQPFQIDRIYVHSADADITIEHNDWWSAAVHEAQRLYYSFIIDYNKIGNVSDDATQEGDVVLTLWIGTGRDQANVIKSMIDELFVSEYGIRVNVQLVDMNTLLRATLSGEGPDVAIQVANTNGIAGAVLNTGNDTPVNYGLRNAVLDLTRFEDFDQVAGRFSESALVPFSFNGATYALPDTQTFPMMFYRKDILAEIGLEVPQTWDDAKVAMSVLSKKQMEFGMLPSEQVFAMLLYQNGGEYYTENGNASALDSDIAINTFKTYCEYYTDYKLDKETSVEERFRTGECPIIIADYTLYNNLQVSAPDILGLWDFTTVPGTLQADGSISKATGASGLADIIMAGTEYPEESWAFLKWWTSAEVQTQYGREMESLMGASARVATANLEALASLSWPIRDYKALTAQLEQVKAIPQVPGGYYSWRNVNNAFFTIAEDEYKKAKTTTSVTPREELMDKVLYINAEITYKRLEFGLPVVEQ